MFDSVRNNKRIVQIFLAMITLPFALWGVDSYVRNRSGGADLAVVGDTTITPQEFSVATREQSDRLRQQLGDQFDPKMMETAEARKAILENLINQRVVALAARDAKLTVSDADLAAFISHQAVFQEDGKFSPERYAALVAARGMSKDAFEYRVRQDIVQQQLLLPVVGSTIINDKVTHDWARSQLEQRTVAFYRLAPEQYVRDAKIDDAQVAAYYEANKKSFETPEQVKVDFVVLDKAQIEATLAVADADIEARYKADTKKYVEEESRRASHILIKVASGAPGAELVAAQAKADEVLAALAKNPKSFADLAAKYSADPGSAQKGGDLGWFGRGAMVKPFEDAVFSMKEGQTSAAVRSDFGLHIIRVTGIKTAKTRTLAEVHDEIAAQLRKELAGRKFAEAGEAFGNAVYEQPDSLQPAADQWKLAIQHSDWLRQGAALPPPFNNAKLATAIFASDAIERKHNTEAVEIAPGRILSARVIEHRPAAQQPIEQVKDEIASRLAREQAVAKAKSQGEAMLATLRSGGKVDIKFGPGQALLRAAPVGLPEETSRQIFRAPGGSLPAYVGSTLADGSYVIFRIDAVTPAGDDDPRINVLIDQYRRTVAEVEFKGYLATLRKRYELTINEKALEALAR